MTKEEILLDHIGEYQVKWRPQTTANIYRAMDSYYNVAIRDAIAKAKMGLDHCELVDNRDGQALMNELIKQLESLKK